MMFNKNVKKLNVYVPVLFKLKDDSAIIHSELLEEIQERLLEISYNDQTVFTKLADTTNEKNPEFDILINDSFFTEFKELDNSINSISARAFYYHHRLIFNTVISYSNKQMTFRKIRMKLIAFFEQLTDQVILKINETINSAPESFLSLKDSKKNSNLYNDIIANLEDIKITSFYQYCVVFQKKSGDLKQNQQIQTFNIPTLQQKYNPFKRESILRISIPNMTAYYTGKLNQEYKSEVINTVYKTCLYAKKIKELDFTNKFDGYDYKRTRQHLVISEELIMEMWSYTLDSFGGKRTDQINNKSTLISFIISLVALVISLVSLLA